MLSLRNRLAVGTRAARDLVLDLFYPPRCLACGGSASRLLCDGCAGSIAADSEPFCPICLAAREDPFGCSAHERRGAVWGVHGGALRDLVHALKYDARRAAAEELARGLARAPAAAALLARADLLVPVPSEAGRRRSRGYHPAAWLASALGRAAGLPVALDLMRRRRGGPSQTRLDPERRAKNVEGAFVVSRANLAAGRRVLLVDDVVTTGATAWACLEALSRAGAAQTGVLAAARAFEKGRGRGRLSYLADR
jgi:ComF family protein